MSLSPYNNINNLRVYPKPVSLPCRRSLVCFLAGAAQIRSSVNGQSTRFPIRSYCRYYLSPSARSSQCIPLTIFHSATRPAPDTPPAAGWLESLFSSPESHVDDACLQTSVKSHGNGHRFTVNYLILTQLPDVVPRACRRLFYFFFFNAGVIKNEINISIYRVAGSQTVHNLP